VLLLAQGVLIKGLVFVGFVGFIVLVLLDVPQKSVTTHAQVLALAYLQDNVYRMMIITGIFAALRITGAVALWRGA
jgi:hypothetical protein